MLQQLLAINKYIKGEISKAELDKLLAVTADYKSDLTIRR